MNSSAVEKDATSTHLAAQPLRSGSLALVLLIVALWGGNAVAVNYSVDWMPPVAVAALRFALGTLVMTVWCAIERVPLRLSRKEFKWSFIAAFLLFTQISTFNIGVMMTNSTHGVLLINTYIFGVSLIEHFVLRSVVLGMRQWLGMMLAGVGVVAIIQVRNSGAIPSIRAFLMGDLVLIFSSVLLATRVVFVRHAVQEMSSSKLIFWHNLLGVAMFAAYSLTQERLPAQLPPGEAIWGILYQGLVVAGLCFVIQAHLLQRHSASQISVFFFATPVFGVIFSVLLRSEPFTYLVALGAGCVATGIWMATRHDVRSS